MPEPQGQPPQADAKRDNPSQENQVEHCHGQVEHGLSLEVFTSVDNKPEASERERDGETEP